MAVPSEFELSVAQDLLAVLRVVLETGNASRGLEILSTVERILGEDTA